jgi:hypothetical protein
MSFEQKTAGDRVVKMEFDEESVYSSPVRSGVDRNHMMNRSDFQHLPSSVENIPPVQSREERENIVMESLKNAGIFHGNTREEKRAELREMEASAQKEYDRRVALEMRGNMHNQRKIEQENLINELLKKIESLELEKDNERKIAENTVNAQRSQYENFRSQAEREVFSRDRRISSENKMFRSQESETERLRSMLENAHRENMQLRSNNMMNGRNNVANDINNNDMNMSDHNHQNLPNFDASIAFRNLETSLDPSLNLREFGGLSHEDVQQWIAHTKRVISLRDWTADTAFQRLFLSFNSQGTTCSDREYVIIGDFCPRSKNLQII